MLIVPLHRAPTLARFPWMTLALILVNVFVFAFLQAGDTRRSMQALQTYVDADLGRWEFPAWRDWRADHPAAADEKTDADPADLPHTPEQAMTWALALQRDPAFVAALHAGELIDPQAEDHALWRERRAVFDRDWERITTQRWLLRYSEFSPKRMFASMFLHGDVGHLVGNMIFLAVLGLLVEGALGPGLFLAVYLLGGLGASLAVLVWRWGEVGAGLGASGAIAALMGAYCVLWGRRRVRFFWWFFFVFDYVRAPALVLLPLWLGWEVFNMLWNAGAPVGFEAHAGGIVCGAALALLVRRLGWERRDFMDEDVAADQAEADRLALIAAEEHIGRLALAPARALLEPIAQRRPLDVEVRQALYRCARCEPGMPHLHVAARAVLCLDPRDPAGVATQKRVFEDYAKASGGRPHLTAAERLALARRWLRHAHGADAVKLLLSIDLRTPTGAACAGELLSLVQQAAAPAQREALRPLLEALVRQLPASPEAGKARVLLTDG